MAFDFSGYKPKAKPAPPESAEVAAEGLDKETDLFRGNLWIVRPKNTDRILRYRSFLKRVRDTEGPEKARRFARKMALRDIYYLAHQVLDYHDLYEPFHGDLCDFIMETDARGDSTLVETARAHFKSSLATTARAIRWMAMDPNVTIGLGSATLKDARPFGRDIRGQLEKNPKLAMLFPETFFKEPRKESDKWTEEEFNVRRAGHIREATVTLFGLEDDMPTGRHFRKILIDDAINKENIGTPDRIKKINDNAELLNPLKVRLEDPIHWVGTPYHLHDYYAKLERLSGYKVYIRSAIEKDGKPSDFAEGGEPAFPTAFKKAKLEQLRQDHGNYLFNTQYRMIRQDAADKKFKREWIRYEDPILPGTKGFNFFICTDPASSRRKESDFTAMLVFGVDWLNRMHLVDGLHDKMNPRQRIDAWFSLAQKWKVMFASYETIGFQKTDAFWLNERMRDLAYYVPIFEVPHHDVNKDERIMGVQPIMESGRFFMPNQPIYYERVWANPDDGYPRTIDVREQILLEMDVYPMAPHDDLLDDIAQARSVWVAGHVPVPPPPPKPGPFDLQTAYGKPVKKDDYNPMAH